jgi:hypothetical protein
MAGVALARNMWLGIERTTIILLAAAYGANTIAELADLIGVITIHPSGENAFSLLSSSVAIWLGNVLTFSLLYWQIDQGNPYAGRSVGCKAGLGLPQPAKPEDLPPTGGRCSSTIYISDTTRRRLSVPPMPCRLRVAPRC